MNLDWRDLALRRRALALESALLRTELQARREAITERLHHVGTSPLALGGVAAAVGLAVRFKAWRWVARALPIASLALRALRRRP